VPGHDTSFTLVELRRLPNVGSDHFPVFAELQYEPSAEAEQDAPKADHEDREEAAEMIEEARDLTPQGSLGNRGKTMDIIRVIIAILLPPLGVFLQEGLGKHFWINILLTLFGYLPGIIHALYIIIKR